MFYKKEHWILQENKEETGKKSKSTFTDFKSKC